MNKHFKRGTAAYNCGCCGKLTRDTGRGEGSMVPAYCAYCYLSGGLENSLSDGCITQAEYDQKIADLKKELGVK